MSKQVLDVGNCGPDHATITQFLESNFGCVVAQADRAEDALEKMIAAARDGRPFDLVVVNRKLDVDYSDGLDVIRQLKANPATAAVPVMLITNYADHQDAAEAAGALRGFGKLQYSEPATVERVRAALA
ncbi:MAG: response regulator [Planctomycetota bacterium]